jgi:CheY-like chemotaxis protein
MTDPTHSLSVLVVDDERDGAETRAILLREFGHQVRTAHTPTAATIAVGTSPADVVLMDIGLPGMDGYRLARRLCERQGRKPLLVAITGYGNLDEQSRDEGFDYHFLKPFDPARLLTLLAAHAGSLGTGAPTPPAGGQEAVGLGGPADGSIPART